MASHTHSRPLLSRLAIAGAFLMAGLTGVDAVAAADSPAAGNAPCGNMMIEELGLVSSAHYNDSCTSLMIQQLGLVSTNDGATVAASEPGSTARQGGVLDETARSADLIALSGGGDTASAGVLDETARSADLIALSPSATLDAAAVPSRGQPF